MSNADIVIKYREFMKERKKMLSNKQIVQKYMMAKESDRTQRLRDLADKNHCNVQQIKDILLDNGVSEDELPGAKKKKVVKEEPPFKPSEPQENNASLLEQMITKLTDETQQLELEIQQLQDELEQKKKKFETMNNAYIALKELETVAKGDF